TAASETVTAASAIITTVEAQVPAATTATLIAAPVRVAAAPSRRRKGVVIRDPEEESTTSIIIPAKTKSKDKGKGILVEEPKPLKKKQQIEQDEQYARELHAELNKNIDLDEAIDHVKRKAKEDPAVKRYQVLKRKPQIEAQGRKNMMMYLKNIKVQIEEDENKALQKINETPTERAAKRRKLDAKVEDLKRHLQIVPNEDDDVYTEATPLAKKDLEALWSLVKERFSIAKPKNFSDDFLLTTLGAMFEMPDVHAQIWKNQRNVHGQAKMILLVERRYPLTRFTPDQILNNVRLKVKEENEVSLELLGFVNIKFKGGLLGLNNVLISCRLILFGFGVDAVEDFKEYTLRDYYCWLKTYCCWYKLKLLDNAADSRLRRLEESAAADEKIKR
nr:hypothetical protein [Tanacetum cinerariifolium]